MESEIINIFNSICDKLNIAYQFTAENIQYILDRYGQYLFVKYCVLMVVTVAALLLLILLSFIIYRSYCNNTWARNEYGLSFIAETLVCGIIIFIPVLLLALSCFIPYTIQSAIMPDLFAVEKIIEMVT